MRRIVHVLLGTSCGALAAMTACDATRSDMTPQRGDFSPAARHAVHSDELQSVMRSLGTEVRRGWPQEIADIKSAQAQRERQARFRKAADLADVLAGSAKAIPQTVADADLSEAQRSAFMAQVEQLQAEARDLEAAASRQNEQDMQQVLSRIRTTCTGCHGQFADLAGPIPFGSGG